MACGPPFFCIGRNNGCKWERGWVIVNELVPFNQRCRTRANLWFPESDARSGAAHLGWAGRLVSVHAYDINRLQF